MSKGIQSPWVSGPGEILRHGLELLRKDNDTNRRLAMISIDNAIELTIKTYLGLPKRITGLQISRSEYQDFSESFPKLLDALEKYASDKLNGIDLGDIEWYHRLRNQLYHQGNGLTVERDKVEVYAELANTLFSNLFGFRLVQPEDNATALLGEFMLAWVNFEKVSTSARHLTKDLALSRTELDEIARIREIRNKVVHGIINHKDVLSPEIVNRLVFLTEQLQKRLEDS